MTNVPSLKAPGRVTRISMSLSEELLGELDCMAAERSAASRSALVSDMIHQQIVDHKSHQHDAIMAGTITLLYNNGTSGLQKRLSAIQFEYIDEVISSLHVNLEHSQTMEVILVQGPAGRLQRIADMLVSQRGVVSGRMHLMAALIPQVHPFSGARPARGAA